MLRMKKAHEEKMERGHSAMPVHIEWHRLGRLKAASAEG